MAFSDAFPAVRLGAELVHVTLAALPPPVPLGARWPGVACRMTQVWAYLSIMREAGAPCLVFLEALASIVVRDATGCILYDNNKGSNAMDVQRAAIWHA